MKQINQKGNSKDQSKGDGKDKGGKGKTDKKGDGKDTKGNPKSKGKESLRRVTFSPQKMVASTVKSAQGTIDY